METGLEIRVFMNSTIEEVLNFKTSCSFKLFDQNLEIHVKNCGSGPVVVPSYIDLKGEGGIVRIDNLFPPGNQRIAPGETLAFYGYLDESLWEASRILVFYDSEGNNYIHTIRE